MAVVVVQFVLELPPRILGLVGIVVKRKSRFRLTAGIVLHRLMLPLHGLTLRQVSLGDVLQSQGDVGYTFAAMMMRLFGLNCVRVQYVKKKSFWTAGATGVRRRLKSRFAFSSDVCFIQRSNRGNET